MKPNYYFFLSLALVCGLQAQIPVFKHSDVVFMYQADQKTYAQYGATALGWGGKPTPKALEEAKGVKFFGSVGMVTEFARYYERFPETYEQGLCRDLNGQPVKVPWLTDHKHKDIPFWWCCTQQPLFRQYLSERVIETVKAGADGVHIDDHLGTSGGLWLGVCFCDLCNSQFGDYLRSLPPEQRQRLGMDVGPNFNFRQTVQQWLTLEQNKKKKVTDHPLWSQFTTCQCRAAAKFMQELRALAAKTAGHPVPIGANAGLLWPRHLVDYQAVDLFSAETDHHAAERKLSDAPIFAYRLAEAVQRPYAATASGQDWAFIKEHNLPGLVQGWIALSYAAGQCLMAPHRQWCYTTEKGTHWYYGPAEKFAPLYQFIRKNSNLFDDYETYADVAVVLPHRSFVKNQGRWFSLCNQLASNNVSYRVLLAGDELVDCDLKLETLRACHNLLVPDRAELLPADGKVLEDNTRNKRVFATVQELLTGVPPAVTIKADGPIRVLPRVKQGAAVIHLLNCQYDASIDGVKPIKDLTVQINTTALGLPKNATWKLLALDQDEQVLQVDNGAIKVRELRLWALLISQTN